MSLAKLARSADLDQQPALAHAGPQDPELGRQARRLRRRGHGLTRRLGSARGGLRGRGRIHEHEAVDALQAGLGGLARPEHRQRSRRQQHDAVLPADDAASELVLQNNVVVGSVNANKRHWYKAAQALAKADPGWLAQTTAPRLSGALTEAFLDAYSRRSDPA